MYTGTICMMPIGGDEELILKPWCAAHFRTSDLGDTYPEFFGLKAGPRTQAGIRIRRQPENL